MIVEGERKPQDNDGEPATAEQIKEAEEPTEIGFGPLWLELGTWKARGAKPFQVTAILRKPHMRNTKYEKTRGQSHGCGLVHFSIWVILSWGRAAHLITQKHAMPPPQNKNKKP